MGVALGVEHPSSSCGVVSVANRLPRRRVDRVLAALIDVITTYSALAGCVGVEANPITAHLFGAVGLLGGLSLGLVGRVVIIGELTAMATQGAQGLV